MNVVVVDDSATVRTMIRNVLERMFDGNVVIKTAEHGKEALEILEDDPCVDLIFLDVNMPVMKGDRFLAIVRSNPCYDDIKIIMTTTEAEADFVKETLRQGANAFIRKPFNMMKAENAIRMVFRRRKKMGGR